MVLKFSFASFLLKDGQLVRLNLRGQGLQCEFPSSEIAKLKFLEKLEMDDNELMVVTFPNGHNIVDLVLLSIRLASDRPITCEVQPEILRLVWRKYKEAEFTLIYQWLRCTQAALIFIA